MGVHHLYEAEQNPLLFAEERAALIRENTRRLCMALTRAGQRLTITCVGELPPFLAQLNAVRLASPGRC